MTFPFRKAFSIMWRVTSLIGNMFSLVVMIAMALKINDLQGELAYDDETIALLDETAALQGESLELRQQAIDRMSIKITLLEGKADRLEHESDLLLMLVDAIKTQRDLLYEVNAINRGRIAQLERDLLEADDLITLQGETLALFDTNLSRTLAVADDYVEAIGFCQDRADLLQAELSACRGAERPPGIQLFRRRKSARPVMIFFVPAKKDSDVLCAM